MKIEVCPICGIKKIEEQFHWSYGNRTASNDAVYSRVCHIAKKKGKDTTSCINPTDGYNEAKAWSELPEELKP